MSRKGENIYKRKDGRWEGRYIKCRDFSGKAKYGYIYGKTYKEVKHKLRESNCFDAGTVKKQNNDDASYESILNAWLDSQKINVKESTYAKYYQVVKTHLCPEIGSIKIRNITNERIETYILHLLDAGRLDRKGGLSQKTACDILSIIKKTIAYAKTNGYSIDCNLDNLHVKKHKGEMRVLSSKEQQKLTKKLLENVDAIKFGVLLSLYTGIRIGEVCALRWNNLNCDLGIVSVKETMQRIKETSGQGSKRTKIIITEPKSECSIRVIPLPSFMIELAKRFRCNNNAYVLTGEQDIFVEPRVLQYRFKSIIKQSEICDANYHSLRHTFATRCVELGFDIKTLSEILGHSSVSITLDRYVHSSLELKRENMQRIKAL